MATNRSGSHLRTFNDAEVAFCAGAECLKRLLVGLALVSRQRDVIAVEFDNQSSLLQSNFVGLNLTCELVKKRPPNDWIAGTANTA